MEEGVRFGPRLGLLMERRRLYVDALSRSAGLAEGERAAARPLATCGRTVPARPRGLLMRLLRNRNPGWSAAAMTFLVATGRYWSPATYGGVGRGTVPPTGGLLADFSAALDVPADDLATLTGFPPARPTSTGSAPGRGSGLVRDVERLTANQFGRVTEFAETLGR